MSVDVATSESKVLVDVEKPTPCCLTLEPAEAIDLAMKLLSAATDAKPAAKFKTAMVRPW
jgi:hypothetical protein